MGACSPTLFCSGPPAGIRSASKVGEVGGGAGDWHRLRPFSDQLEGFEPSISIFWIFLLASASGGMTTVCICKAFQPASLANPTPPPIDPSSLLSITHTHPAFSDIIKRGPLALLAIGLPACVTRAARIHLLIPESIFVVPACPARLTSRLPALDPGGRALSVA